MATKIYEGGNVEVTVPAGEKIAVFSNGPHNTYQHVGYPNLPTTLNLLNAGAAGTTYTSAAFAAATLVRVEMGADFGFYEVGAAPVVAEPLPDQEFADATGVVSGLAAAQGGSATLKGGTSATAGNAGGAAALLGGQPGTTGVGGAATVTGGAGGSVSGTGGAAAVTGGAGTAGNANGGSVELTPGAAHGTGLAGNVGVHGNIVIDQGAPNAQTVAATLTIANLLTKIVTGTHAAGATQAYTLPTGTLTDAGVQMAADEAFDWVLINLSAAAADSITVTAGVDHTLVGSGIVPSAHATTGGLSSNAGTFRTRKTAANTFVTYRIG